MKIMISYQVDTIEEAKSILEAVDTKGEMKTFRVQDEPEAVFEQVSTTDRPNVSPGEPGISKISQKTVDEITYHIKQGFTPLARFAEHYKLMWKRNMIGFDGKDYYL